MRLLNSVKRYYKKVKISNENRKVRKERSLSPKLSNFIRTIFSCVVGFLLLIIKKKVKHYNGSIMFFLEYKALGLHGYEPYSIFIEHYEYKSKEGFSNIQYCKRRCIAIYTKNTRLLNNLMMELVKSFNSMAELNEYFNSIRDIFIDQKIKSCNAVRKGWIKTLHKDSKDYEVSIDINVKRDDLNPEQLKRYLQSKVNKLIKRLNNGIFGRQSDNNESLRIKGYVVFEKTGTSNTHAHMVLGTENKEPLFALKVMDVYEKSCRSLRLPSCKMNRKSSSKGIVIKEIYHHKGLAYYLTKEVKDSADNIKFIVEDGITD